ncbi:MAG TPA: ABC transporter permease [Terracidiphilus sp.]
MWAHLKSVFRNLLDKRRVEAELDDEIRSYVEILTDEKIVAGCAPEEARRLALTESGGMEQVRQAVRDRRAGTAAESVIQDLRYGLRGFRRSKAFTVSAVLTLALAIGATTAVFSVVDPILFRALPYANPGQLVSAGFTQSLEREEFLTGKFYEHWLANQKPFATMASQGMSRSCDLAENHPAELVCVTFQAEMLRVLGVSPVLGRNFLPDEDVPHGPPVVMISYALWQGHFSGDRQIVGREINIDGNAARVVGVLPPGFQFPTLEPADVVQPMALDAAAQNTSNGGFGWAMRTFARLKPGVSLAEARAEMRPVFDAEKAWFPAVMRDQVRLSVRPLRARQVGDARRVAWILLAAVAAVQLIACANVAGLLVARGAAREREMAVRAALGATPRRLARQALTEALLLALTGAVAGLALAGGLLRASVALAPSGVPFLATVHMDLRIAAFTVVLALACGVLFGLITALHRPDGVLVNTRSSLSRRHVRLRRALVVGQIAASVVLLAGAALLLRSFHRIEEQRLGFTTHGVMTAQIALPASPYNTDAKWMDFHLQVEQDVRRLPGVTAVAFSDSVPPGGWHGATRFSDITVEGRPRPSPGEPGMFVTRRVSSEYFRALDIPVIRGRGFTNQESTDDVRLVVLSRLAAAELFQGEDPIGKRIEPFGMRANQWVTVAGVAEDAKNNGLTSDEQPEIYFLRREVANDWSQRRAVLVIASALPQPTVAGWVQAAVHHLNPTVPVEMAPLREEVDKLADRPRFETALLGFFALMGLAMAAVGIYGILAYLTSQRTQEIGVRMALGATRVKILKLIARDGVRMVLAGGVLGLAAALGLVHVLRALLYQTSTYDALAFIAVPVVLGTVAAAAVFLPALAGMRVEPASVLRNE